MAERPDPRTGHAPAPQKPTQAAPDSGKDELPPAEVERRAFEAARRMLNTPKPGASKSKT